MCKTVKSKMKYLNVILLCCVLASCRTQEKVVYLQDAADRKSENIIVFPGIVIQPKDILSIIVSSTMPELSLGFNLPLQSYQPGSTSASINYSSRLLGYLVDVDGFIDFPRLGRLKVSGITRDQLAQVIKQKIIDDGQIKDPIVNVEFMNFRITVLGEVRSPGRFDIQDDRITIFEALGRAGDLTLYGRRDNVLVQRVQNGVIHEYRVDLRSTAIYQSPVFYMHQNDIIYVSPNNTVAARSRINENRTVGVAVNLASFLTNIVVLLITLK